MRSDWQTHCLVITVWWTFIVFRLVETETCCALACCTNANLFHVDIISHCLLSNHNTCLTFLYNENVLPRVYFILAAMIFKKGEKVKKTEWTYYYYVGHSTLRTLKLFNTYISKGLSTSKCEINGRDKHLEATVTITCLIYHTLFIYVWDNTYHHQGTSYYNLKMN